MRLTLGRSAVQMSGGDVKARVIFGRSGYRWRICSQCEYVDSLCGDAVG